MRALAGYASALSMLLAGMLTAPAHAQQSAAKGELKVGDQTYPLTQAYVMELDDVEGIRLDGTPKRSLVVQLTDAPIAPDAVGSTFRLADLARAGKLHGVELRIDPATGKLFGAAVYCLVAELEPALLNITLMNSDRHVLKNFKAGPTVSGTAMMPAADEWPTLKENAKPRTFQYNATFSAPLRRQSPVTAVLTPAQAAASPVVQAMLTYETACRKGDFAAARKLATPAAAESWNAAIAQQGEAEFRKMVKTLLPDGKTRLKQITKVVVRGDRATVLLKEEGALSWQPLVKVNGVWLVDAP